MSAVRDPWERHLLALIDVLRLGDDEPELLMCSAFVVDIRDTWFLVYPGHYVEKMQEARDKGYERVRSYLLTFVKPHDQPLVFDWNKPDLEWVNEDEFDYAVLRLGTYYHEHLLAAKVVPILPAKIACRGDDADSYHLIGVHSQTGTIVKGSTEDSLRIAHPVLDLERLEDWVGAGGFWRLKFDARQALEHTKVDDRPFGSVEGMSGGPVFGFSRLPDGQNGYRLFGMQSSWLPKTATLFAVPMDALVAWLESAVTESTS